MSEPIRMVLEGYPCKCPGTPHLEEWVDLEPAATVMMAMAAQSLIEQNQSADVATGVAMLVGQISPVLMRFGIRRWSFTAEKGARIGVDATEVERLLPMPYGLTVAEKCMDLYLGDIMRPLEARRSKLLGLGPTGDSTAPIPSSGDDPQKQSAPSLPENMDGSPSEVPVL
jgi:hypothetical protein